MAEDLSKRGKVKGQYRSGGYKKQRAKGRQVSGLTKKQVAAGRRVGKAGRSKITKKEAKASYKNIDISQTRWKAPSERTGPRAKGGIVVDKSGKPITGTVKLASGKTATYVRGKRVTYKAKPTGRGRGGGGGGSSRASNIPTTRVSPSARGEGSGTTSRPKPKTIIGRNKPLTKGEPPGRFQSKSRPAPGTRPKPSSGKTNQTRNMLSTSAEARAQGKNYTSQPRNPRIGDTWTQRYSNGRTITRRYTANGWRVVR